MKITTNCNDTNTHAVLETSFKVFSKYCSIRNIDKIFIYFDSERECPECFKESGTIYIQAHPTNWSRVAYQLFHELCHCSIRQFSHPKFLWFEESICELSSYFFLEKLTEYWKVNNILLCDVNGVLYADHFSEYALKDMKKSKPFELSKLSTDNIKKLRDMESNGCIRELNATISINLLPLFKENENLWEAITYLGGTYEYQDHITSLNEWKNHSPSTFSDSIDKVISLFTVDKLIRG